MQIEWIHFGWVGAVSAASRFAGTAGAKDGNAMLVSLTLWQKALLQSVK